MLLAKRSTSWQATPNNRAIANELITMKGVRRSRLGGDAIEAMAEPGAGKPHQLLTTHGQGRQHRQQLDVLNQQTIQQSQDEHAKDSKTQLEQSKLHFEAERPHRK